MICKGEGESRVKFDCQKLAWAPFEVFIFSKEQRTACMHVKTHTFDGSSGEMATEKIQWTPGRRYPSSSHSFRAMHSLRITSSGSDPGAVANARLAVGEVKVVAAAAPMGG